MHCAIRTEDVAFLLHPFCPSLSTKQLLVRTKAGDGNLEEAYNSCHVAVEMEGDDSGILECKKASSSNSWPTGYGFVKCHLPLGLQLLQLECKCFMDKLCHDD